MSEGRQTSCPFCHTSFHVKEEQLQSADGQVRCGVCLRVFNGYDGDAEFIAPQVTAEEAPVPLANISVQAMEHADLPESTQPAPTGLKALLLLLLIVLAGQLGYYQFGLGQKQAPALAISQLVVRSHPEREQALRMDAILHNRSDQAQPYPALFLYFDNRYGERRAQRLFLPAEYLPARLVESGQLPPHTRVQISLGLHDPGQGSVNYGLAVQTVPAKEN